jgi:hypothetical protein
VIIVAATGAFQVLSWDENPYESGDDGRKLTEAVVGQRFEGDLEGEGQARWLMCYRPDGTAAFVGLQRVEGTLEGRRGSLVFQTAGSFDGQVARWSAEVVEGSATGELQGLAADGTFEAPMGSTASFSLDVRLP